MKRIKKRWSYLPKENNLNRWKIDLTMVISINSRGQEEAQVYEIEFEFLYIYIYIFLVIFHKF